MKVIIQASDIAYLDHVTEQIAEGYTSGHYDRHNHWEIVPSESGRVTRI